MLLALNTAEQDRAHAAMLLQAGGYARVLRALIAAEQDRGPEFLRRVVTLGNRITSFTTGAAIADAEHQPCGPQTRVQGRGSV